MFCIPIIARNTEEAYQKMVSVKDLADVFEIRLDFMDTFDLRSIIQSSPKPILVTYRSKKEGGQGSAEPTDIANYLTTAVEAGAAYVDIELTMPELFREKVIKSKKNTSIIVSTHIPDHTPSRSSLQSLFEKSVESGADVVKIVTHAATWRDNLKILELIPLALDNGVHVIAFCMGPIGRISRIAAHLMGAYLTFTSLDTGQESASGQIPVHEMKNILEHFI